ncbi:MAG: SIS domain-containing protein [Lachnospiraceae bacterium]|nr:SIS domain-containing protein [Lachnospiraceae bacterium]
MISYFEKQLKEINDAIHSLNESEFRRLVCEAVEVIDSGHKIIVSGLGKNVPVCEKFVGSMVSLGMDACYLNTNSAVHGDMGVVKDSDMVIVLTKSGETSESVYLAELLQNRKVNIWMLSFSAESTLSRLIKNRIIIELGHEGDPWNIMPNNSTTLNLIVLQGLVMMIAKERKISVEDFRRNHPGGHIGKILQI